MPDIFWRMSVVSRRFVVLSFQYSHLYVEFVNVLKSFRLTVSSMFHPQQNVTDAE
jgi:hypothetical protein